MSPANHGNKRQQNVGEKQLRRNTWVTVRQLEFIPPDGSTDGRYFNDFSCNNTNYALLWQLLWNVIYSLSVKLSYYKQTGLYFYVLAPVAGIVLLRHSKWDGAYRMNYQKVITNDTSIEKNIRIQKGKSLGLLLPPITWPEVFVNPKTAASFSLRWIVYWIGLTCFVVLPRTTNLNSSCIHCLRLRIY